MLIEIIGHRPLPDEVDRDDVEDLLADVLGERGEVSGAGVGGTGWNLDLEVPDHADDLDQIVADLATALTQAGLGWVALRAASDDAAVPAENLVWGAA